MSSSIASRSPAVTSRAILRPEGESSDLAKQVGTPIPQTPHSSTQVDAGGGGTPACDREAKKKKDERIVVVQLKVVACGQEHVDALFALRNIQHRMLNAAMRSWWETDGDDYPAATKQVAGVLERERAYCAEQIPKIEQGIEKLRPKVGRMSGVEKPPDGRDVEKKDLQKEMLALQKRLKRAQIGAALFPPSVISDACVRFTQGKYKEYKKHSWRGTASMATFRDGQPVRVKSGGWEIKKAERAGSYDLEFPVQSNGRKVEYATMRVIPDGPSMYGWAKMLVEGKARPCDARLVYAEKKKQWFAKVTIAVPSVRLRPVAGTAALRRGVRSAFVIVAENGDVHTIDGNDVIVHKRKAHARRQEIGRHLRSGELGNGARGHGKRRRFKALRDIDDAEKRYVDSKMKTWAAFLAKWCLQRSVSKLLVADGSVSEFKDRVDDEELAAFLHKWPMAAMNDRVAATMKNAGIEVELVKAGFNARRCPAAKCGHEHAKRSSLPTFECEVCGYERPQDQVVAWNMLHDAVGSEPIKRRDEKKQAVVNQVRSAIRK